MQATALYRLNSPGVFASPHERASSMWRWQSIQCPLSCILNVNMTNISLKMVHLSSVGYRANSQPLQSEGLIEPNINPLTNTNNLWDLLSSKEEEHTILAASPSKKRLRYKTLSGIVFTNQSPLPWSLRTSWGLRKRTSEIMRLCIRNNNHSSSPCGVKMRR